MNDIWKFFVSVKLTVFLLLSMAATSIIGTLIPQNENPAVYFRAYGEFVYRLFDVLNIFDMYHSWWFQLLIVLLTINILVCSIDRLSATWKIIFVKTPAFKIARFKKQAAKAVGSHTLPPDQLKDICTKEASRGFGYVRIEPFDEGFRVFAEKWRQSRLGVYVVHLSVVTLLVGGLVGSLFGFDGFVTIPEGESVDHIQLRNSNEMRPLDFAIRCNDFSVTFYESGQPKEFRSSLSLTRDGKTIYEKEIIVNDPIRYEGINIFQASYGKMAPEAPTASTPPPKEISLVFTSVETGMAYGETVTIGQEITLPEGAGTFVLKNHTPSADFMGQKIGEALTGLLTPPQGEPVEVLLPLRFPNFDKMRRGNLVIAVTGHKAEKFVPGASMGKEPRYYTGLQVTNDPGIWLVYTGFLLMIVGCFITFFMSHQQLCIEVQRRQKGSRIMISGICNRNRTAMTNKVQKISKSLAVSDDASAA